MPAKPTPLTVEHVERLRAEITTVKAEIAAVAAAPVPLTEAERHLVAHLDALAALYQHHIGPMIESFTRETDPSLGLVELLLPDARYDPQLTRAFLVSVLRKELVTLWCRRLHEQYEADQARAAAAIPVAERPERIATLRSRLHALEIAEERAIIAAQHQGMRIDRREDCDPAVLFDNAVLEEAS